MTRTFAAAIAVAALVFSGLLAGAEGHAEVCVPGISPLSPASVAPWPLIVAALVVAYLWRAQPQPVVPATPAVAAKPVPVPQPAPPPPPEAAAPTIDPIGDLTRRVEVIERRLGPEPTPASQEKG